MIKRISIGLSFAIMVTVVGIATAQAPTLTLDVEYDLGFSCPTAAAMQPGTSTLWVLMDNCVEDGYYLRPFDIDSETFLDDQIIPIEGLDFEDYIARFTVPLAFTPDGALELIAFDTENYNPQRFQIDVETGDLEEVPSEEMTALLRQFTEYPETTIFSPDHTLAVARATESIHVVNLQSGEVVFELDIPADYGVFPMFSADNQLLYVTQLDEPDNMENNDSTVHVYQLANGELLQSQAMIGFTYLPSPDGNTFMLQVGDDQISLFNLNTGETSEPLGIWEEPSKVMTCVNTGNDVSDVDFTRSGRLTLMDGQWLPDSSGFFTVNSYGGQAAGGGGTPCIFDYSRLRRYSAE